MAARVNTKFIVIVGAAVLALVAGVALLSAQAIKKSGDGYIRLGDQAMEAGKPGEAVGFYARAVFKDQKNAGWIRKWIAAMEKDIPSGRTAYIEAYDRQYKNALRALPEADPTDFDAHKKCLEETYAEIKGALGQDPRSSIEVLEHMVKFSNELIENYRGDEGKGRVLLRYRALPRASLLARNPSPKQSEIDTTRKDLEAALAADPKDADSALALFQLDAVQAELIRKRGDIDEADRVMAESRQRLRAYAADHPPAAKVRLTLLLQEAEQAARTAEGSVSLAEVLRDRRQQVQEFIDAVKAERPEDVEVGLVDRAAQFALIVLPAEAGRAEADAVIAHVLRGQPDNAALLLAVAQLEMMRGETAKAEETLRKVVDMPDKPLSYAGKQLFGQRLAAILAQTDAAFGRWEATRDPSERAALAAKAKKYRDDLVARIGDTAPEVLSLDARLLFINGDRSGARTLLTRYNELTGQRDTRSMALLGQLLAMQGNAGAAKQAFQRVLERDPRNPRALRQLGILEQNAGNYPESLRYLKQLLALTPQDRDLAEQIERVESAITNKDPIGVRLLEIERTARGVGADVSEAIRMAEELLKENKTDLRCYVALTQLQMAAGDRAAALATLESASRQFPDNQMVKDGIRSLNEDPIPARIAEVEKAAASPADKAKARYIVYMQGGEKYGPQADAAFEEMVRIAPEDPMVFEYRFQRAAQARDSGRMAELVSLAEAKNLDQLNGQLYRARQLVVEKKYAEAVPYLRGAVEKDKQNQAAWRTLGMVQLELRNPQGAAEALGKAVEIRPNDVPAINGLLRALIQSGNMSEALSQARRSEQAAGADPEFAELYIQLLTEVPGGDKDKAEEYRERIAKSKPEDRLNLAQLALLRMEQRKYGEARECIDELKKDERSRDLVVELEARWFALQGKYGEAQKVLDDYISALPAEKRNEGVFIAASRTFFNVGQPDRALAYLERGRPLEKPETMMVSREMGDVLFNTGKPAEAAEAYKRVLDAGSRDEGDALTKRMLECFQKQRDWARFDALLASMGEKAQKDATVLVLAAEAALQQGDESRARKLYDQAVVADPKNPIVFLKRGDYAARDVSNEKDALLDYEQAAKLAPSWTLPLQRIALVHKGRGRIDRAADAVGKIVELDPNDDSARMELISLRVRMGDETGMTTLIDDAIRLKPDSIGWLMRAGGIMSELRKHDEAAAYYARAWEKRKGLDVAVAYATALIAKTPPDLALAWRVASAKELESADEVPGRLLRAMVLQKSKRPEEAYAEIERAYLKIDPNDPQQSQLFMSGVESAFSDDPRAQLALLERLDRKKKLEGWMYVQACRPRLQDEQTRAATAAAVESFIASQTDPSLKLSTYRMMGMFYYQVERFDRAAEMYRKYLEIQPDDAETLNNLAYTLAAELKQPGDALRYAERAVELSPNVPNFIDTLGVVQLGLKNTDAAIRTLGSALEKSQTDNERVPTMIHLAKAHLAKGDNAAARGMAERASEILGRNAGLRQQYQKPLKEVTDQLESK